LIVLGNAAKIFPSGKKHQKREEISSREDDHDDDDDNTLELGSERSSEGGNSNHNHHHSPSNSCKELEKEGRMMVFARNSIHYDDYVTVGSNDAYGAGAMGSVIFKVKRFLFSDVKGKPPPHDSDDVLEIEMILPLGC